MRITGGIYKGRNIKCPKGVIRPAMDRMRESMFSILGSLQGQSFLDLFSGSGLVGIEAASRGAEPVQLVEMDRQKRRVIMENISIVESSISLTMIPAERFIKCMNREFDIIYMDPPFDYREKEKLLRTLPEEHIKNSTVIIHFPKEDTLSEQIESLTMYDKRKYGRSQLWFYHAKGNE